MMAKDNEKMTQRYERYATDTHSIVISILSLASISGLLDEWIPILYSSSYFLTDLYIEASKHDYKFVAHHSLSLLLIFGVALDAGVAVSPSAAAFFSAEAFSSAMVFLCSTKSSLEPVQ